MLKAILAEVILLNPSAPDEELILMSAGSTSSDKGLAVLIVDDEPNIAMALEYLLRHNGYAVKVAHDGAEALAVVEQWTPDLVVLDVVMPGIDGLETCRRLKAVERTRDIPVIFMTAKTAPESKLAGFQAGGVDYITKPFQLEEVLARVSAHVSLRVMQLALAERNAALQRARDELEARVRERTAELAQLNENLKAEIVERKRAEQSLREEEARVRRLVDSNIIGIIFWDLGGGISEANDAFLQIVGYSRDDLKAGKIDWARMTPPEYVAADEIATEELRQRGSCTPYEKEYIRADGSRVPVLLGGAFLEGSQQQGVAFVLDLTAQKRAENRIRFMAQHDPLTGLPNRVLFQDRVGQAIAHAHRDSLQTAVLLIDLDYFKNVNESLGHQAGDRLLRAVSRRLQRCLGEGDTVARLGGDEFVINLLEVSGGSDAALLAQKVVEALAQPSIVDGHELHITASIGISLYPSDGEDAEALMRAADTATYYAKERGRNSYQFFTATLNESVKSRLTIANNLHQAIERGEFALHFQPQVEIETGRIFSAEALIRWRQPDAGLIPPSAFIKIAEETGLIPAVGEWVLLSACRQLRRWRDEGHSELRISVNLSPHQFRRPGFDELVARILSETGLPAAALELELTEGMLMLENKENVALLELLAKMGVQLALDDFGTGYSSLTYLHRFPIHTLKIDQSFVNGIGHDPHDTAIVTAVIAMARSLHLNVVAEGVESSDQVDFLKAQGCPAAQGFYYAKPMSAAALSEMLNQRAGIAKQSAPPAGSWS